MKSQWLSFLHYLITPFSNRITNELGKICNEGIMACFMVLFQHLPERMERKKKQPTTSAVLVNLWAEIQT